MRPLTSFIMILAASFTAACSAVSGPDLSMHPGYHGHGVYAPTEEELAYDCKSLVFVLNKSIQQINAMPELARTQLDAPPTSVVLAVQRVSGGGLPVLDDYKRERAKLAALAHLSQQKKCPPIDAEAQTKTATEKMTTFRKGREQT